MIFSIYLSTLGQNSAPTDTDALEVGWLSSLVPRKHTLQLFPVPLQLTSLLFSPFQHAGL